MIISRQDAKSLLTVKGGVIDAIYAVRDDGCDQDKFRVTASYDGRDHALVGFPTEVEAISALDQIQDHFQKIPGSALRGIDDAGCLGQNGSPALLRLGHNVWCVLDFGEIHVVYAISPSRAQDGKWHVIYLVDGSRRVLATVSDEGEALARFTFLTSELRRSLEPRVESRGASSISSALAGIKGCRRKWLAVPALACVGALALYGAGHLMTGTAPNPMAESPSLPPSVFQGMMADQNDDAENAIQMLRRKVDSVQARRAPSPAKAEGLKDGYSVSPRDPIAIPGMDAPAPVASPGQAAQAPVAAPDGGADIESMQKKLSILSGVDNTAPLPGSDIGNYRDMQKVLPDISATHH